VDNIFKFLLVSILVLSIIELMEFTNKLSSLKVNIGFDLEIDVLFK